ncbi:MAG: UDP-N-acetylmuramoyl-L-alanyl-D-glutamate--2,6-diaminopimelate ligase [Clostridia bacterium]|nr:UDP-N-acetylmuramoyl-L-alanyl-D-glutamate--2,6-diaminopimelate ligase [Clostridia bacterium]
MKLSKLLKGVKIIESINFNDIEILNITDNSNQIKESTIFCCVVGEKIDAHSFIPELAKQGCQVFLVEKINKEIKDIIQIKVDNVRKEMCVLISNFYENCHTKMQLIGVTGTNGKTSITFILKNAFEKLKQKVGIIGTTGYYIGNKKYDTTLTTPDSLDLHKILYQMYKSGVEIVVMEVSAHSIYLNKIYGLKFKYGIFTNLTQDHLDYFKTMDEYANTKFKFLQNDCEQVIINVDDNYGANYKITKNCKTYSTIKKSDLYSKNFQQELFSMNFDVVFNDEVVNFNFDNCGLHNVYNILASTLVLLGFGYSLKKIQKIIATTPQIKGRLDFISVKDYIVCIDYAHTPDALLNVLSTIKPYTNDLIVVFGSSGNRDSLKRADMGIIVSKFADYIILTSDNPRYENESDIFVDLAKNISKPYTVEKDRAKAIKFANEIANKDSIILICGKGVEDYQDLKAVNVSYSDYEEVEKFK